MCPRKATNILGVNPKTYLFSTSSHPDAISINSLDITLLKPNIDFTQYDYFIITSKQVSESLKQYDLKLLKQALCISSATALSYENIGAKVLETGEGYGDSLSAIISKYSKSTKWLYLRAKVISSDFVLKAKRDGYDIDESIIYESSCSKKILDIKVEEDAILIFTSPSSIDCFLKNNQISNANRVIVIGNTTALRLAKNIKYQIAKDRTIQSCLNLI